MSTKKLEWLFGLDDKMSGPASVAEKKLELLERRIKSVAKAESEMSGPKKERLTFARLNLEIQRDQLRGAGKHEKEEGFHSHAMEKVQGLIEGTKKLAAGATSWVGLLDHGLGIVEKVAHAAIAIGEAFVHAAEQVGHLIYRFGELGVEAASAKENTIITFKALLGSESAAEAMVESLERLSYVSPFSSDQAVGLGRKLIAGGFGPEQVPTLLRALGDAAAATGAGFEKADEAVGALRRIRAEGTLSTKTLRALSAAGVPAGAVYERLGEVFGVTALQARELVKAGKVDSANALFAIVGAVKDKRSGGALGDAAQRYATETLSGLRKSIADKKEELFGDLFKSAGFGSFKGFLKNVNEALDPENPIGKRIRDRVTGTFNRIFTALFGPLTGDQGLERIEKVVNKVLLAIDLLVGAGRMLWNVFEGFVTGVLAAFGLDVDELLGAGGALDPANIEVIVRAAHQLGWEFGYIATKVELAIDWVFGFSKAIDQAMGLVEPFAKLMDLGGRIVGLGGGGEEIDEQKLKVWKAWKMYQARSGEQIPLGAFIHGYANGKITMPAPQPSVTAHDLAKGTRSRVFSPKVENHINVQGAAAADPEAIGEAVADATTDSLSTWENASMAMGATDG
jgi:tape measure domain-containing protein